MSRMGLSLDDSPNMVSRLMPLMQEEIERDKQRYLYLNPAQLLCYNFGARTTYARCGRGFGKTTYLLASRLILCVQTIPRSEGLFLGNSIKQLYTKTMPQVISGIENVFGLREGVHFFRGQAPKSMNFKMPLKKPRIWENVVHWYNGACTYMVSMEIKASANGFNSSYILSDETRYLPWKKVQEEVLPTLRGGMYDHPGWDEKRNPYYLSSMWVSDAALTVKQSEWEKNMDDQTEDVNEQIADMLAELNIVPQLAENQKFLRKLNALRCQSRVFFNFSSVENIDILGERYIAEQKRQLPELIFNIQIMGQRKGVAKDGYYANFDIDVHGYMPSESDQTNVIYSKFSKKFVNTVYKDGRTRKVEYEAPDLDETSKIRNCELDTDIDPDLPLRIAFDYGAVTNYVVTGQTRPMDGVESLLVLSSFYVRNERKLRALCGDWCRYYEPHRRRNPEVIYYYDSTAKQGGAYALDNADDTKFYNVVKEELEKRKWKVTMVPMGRPMRHSEKYQFVNDVLIGRQKPFLRVNRENNEYLIVSIENAKVKMTSNGPAKVKDLEKYKSEDGVAGPYEERTDFSDAMDTLLIGVRYFNTSSFYFSRPRLG